jgi:hypothetical protein
MGTSRYKNFVFVLGLVTVWLGHHRLLAVPFGVNEPIACDLLVVGGNESAVAAAIQAARLGVRKIILANDGHWLGGQFTSEGLGAVDEWTKYRGGRVPFPRSGLFLEIMTLIEDDMERKYGLRRPGNCFCAWTTCEPRNTEALFRRLIAPYLRASGGPIEMLENVEPVRVTVERNRIVGVEFEVVGTMSPAATVSIRPTLTIDASDWGDVVRVSGASYFCGPDLKQRFDEPSAPASYDDIDRNEINPITYCMVLRESDQPTVIERPPHYDENRYLAATTATRDEFKSFGWPAKAMAPFALAWKDTALPNGPYTDGPTVYHHRRLVDRRHNRLAAGTEAVLVNWPLQDYPTNAYPQHVVDALESVEPGASQKNLVEMSPRLRQIVFDDAKAHTLGLLHHLQTTVADRDLAAAAKEGRSIVTFRDLRLTDEFGTPDRLPPKPYIREGLRTECLYMLREQDVRDTDGNQCWAASMVSDGVFGFQFNIDFHPTKRIFKNDDPHETWTLVHTPLRNWSTDTDRAMLPLRSLVPKSVDGLLVAGKNLGLSSIVQSAVRLHGHGMLAGQAAATIAAVCLDRERQPRDLACDKGEIRVIQSLLLGGGRVLGPVRKPPGVLLWPYHDVPPDADYFRAANWAAVLNLYVPDSAKPDFDAEHVVTREEVAEAAWRVNRLVGNGTFVFSDKDPITTRRELVLAIDRLIAESGWRNKETPFLQPGGDSDADGVPDLSDPLPHDADNDGVSDLFDVPRR